MKTIFFALLVVTKFEGIVLKCVDIECSSPAGFKECGHSSISSNQQITSIKSINAKTPQTTHEECDDGHPLQPDGEFIKPWCHTVTIPAKPCEEGYTFGFNKHKIWVDLKCSGKFNVCYEPASKYHCVNRHLTSGEKQKWYPVDINDDVRLMTVYKKQANKCIAKSTYWYQGKRVWLKKKCKAHFRICIFRSKTSSNPRI